MSQQVELACRAADRGRFDEALRVAAGVPAERVEYAACRALMGSVYRQVGRHADAELEDRAGLAAQQPDPLGQAMCRLGLVADRIGAADARGARAAMIQADAALAEVPAWHWAGRWFDPWLTRAWVYAELCLVGNDPAAAMAELVPFASVKPRPVPGPRWSHDRAKTLLFLGVAQRIAGDPAARTTLAAAADLAESAELNPLLVPAVDQLHEVDPPAANRLRGPVAQAQQQLRQHQPPSG